MSDLEKDVDLSDVPRETGVTEDSRSDEEKGQDWKDDQFAASAPIVEWREKTKKERRYFSKRNQRSSSSCMAQSGVKMAGIDNFLETGQFIDFSALQVYRSRANFPGTGMTLQNLLHILTTPVLVKEEDLKSQNMNESEMNSAPINFTEAMKRDAEMFREQGYIQLPIEVNPAAGQVVKPIDINRVAELVESGKGVEIILFFTSEEYWRNRPQILVPDLGRFEERTSRHGVCVVDYYVENGEKILLVEDSAGNNSSIDKKGQREITQAFFEKRCYGAGYMIDRKNALEKAIKLIVTLRRGSTGEQVRVLQEMLGGGLVQDGVFGSKTELAVKEFQKKHGLGVDGIVGPKTRAVINNLSK